MSLPEVDGAAIIENQTGTVRILVLEWGAFGILCVER
jgi:hypothetical protein